MESEISRDTKTLIRSLLTSNPQQMTLGRLIQDYKNEVGCDIPYRQLGFNSAEQYLNSIPDTVRVQGRGNGAFVDVVLNETSRHINEMIAKQKKAKHGRYGLRSSLNENRQAQVKQPQAHYSRQNYPVYQQPLLQYPYQGFPSYMQNARYPQQPQYCQPAQFHQLQHFHQPQRYHQPQHYSQQSRNTTSRHNPPPNKQIPNIRPVETKKEPEAIKKEPEIKREPPKIPVTEPKPSPQDKPVAEPVSKLVRNEQQTPSSTSRLGIDWKARAALPSYIKEESGPVAPKPQKPLLLDMVDDEIYDSDDEENMVPEDVRRKLQRLIESHPEGIWCCDLPKLYYNSYNTELKYMAYGFRTMSEMCIYLKKEFHCIRLGKADFKLYDKRKPRPPDLSLNLEVPIETPCDNSNKDELHPSELKDLFETELPSIPEEAVQYLQDIPRQWLPEDVTQGQFIDLNIGEVYDPSKFWFITRFDELNDLMDEMQTFYTANAEKLAIPNCMFREGLYCAALFLGEYHRAVIVGKIVPNKAKVYYIDYGTIYITDFKDICYLHKKFSQLPAQAIRGRLSNVVPLGKMTQWPNETSKAFLDLVRMKSLVGRLDKIDNKKQLVYLTLIEPRGEASKDLYINQALVDQKLAVATLEDQIDVEISKHAFPVVKHLHLFPTFEEIEQGIVPSAIEMITLTKTMPFELIYPHYFKKFYYKNDLKELQHPGVKREEDSSICETSTASFESFKQNVRTSSSLEEKDKVSGRTSMFKLKTTKELLPELDSLKLEGDEVKQEVPPQLDAQDTTSRVLRPPPGLKPIIDASGAPFSYSNMPQCVPAYYPPQQERVPVQNFYNIFNMVPGGGYYPIQNVHNPYQMQLAYPSQRDQICTGWEGPPFEQFPQPQQILPPPCQNYPEWSTKVSNESVGVKDISIQTPEDCGLWKSDDEDSNMNLSPKDDTVFKEYLQNLGNVEDANPVDSRTNGKFSADNSDENCDETVKEIKKRYVTQSEFHGKLLHVVNLNDETFVLTEEIIKSCSNKVKSIVDLRKRLMIRHVPIVLKDMNLNAIDKNVLDELYSEGIIPTTLTSAFIQVVPVAQVSPLLDFLNVLQV